MTKHINIDTNVGGDITDCTWYEDKKHIYSTNIFTGKMHCLCGAVI